MIVECLAIAKWAVERFPPRIERMRLEPILQCPSANSKTLRRAIHVIHGGGGHRCTGRYIPAVPDTWGTTPLARTSEDRPCTARSAGRPLEAALFRFATGKRSASGPIVLGTAERRASHVASHCVACATPLFSSAPVASRRTTLKGATHATVRRQGQAKATALMCPSTRVRHGCRSLSAPEGCSSPGGSPPVGFWRPCR